MGGDKTAGRILTGHCRVEQVFPPANVLPVRKRRNAEFLTSFSRDPEKFTCGPIDQGNERDGELRRRAFWRGKARTNGYIAPVPRFYSRISRTKIGEMPGARTPLFCAAQCNRTTFQENRGESASGALRRGSG